MIRNNCGDELIMATTKMVAYIKEDVDKNSFTNLVINYDLEKILNDIDYKKYFSKYKAYFAKYVLTDLYTKLNNSPLFNKIFQNKNFIYLQTTYYNKGISTDTTNITAIINEPLISKTYDISNKEFLINNSLAIYTISNGLKLAALKHFFIKPINVYSYIYDISNSFISYITAEKNDIYETIKFDNLLLNQLIKEPYNLNNFVIIKNFSKFVPYRVINFFSLLDFATIDLNKFVEYNLITKNKNKVKFFSVERILSHVYSELKNIGFIKLLSTKLVTDCTITPLDSTFAESGVFEIELSILNSTNLIYFDIQNLKINSIKYTNKYVISNNKLYLHTLNQEEFLELDYTNKLTDANITLKLKIKKDTIINKLDIT